MFSRWLRLGVRAQILVIVLIGTVLTTAVTLLIADTSIQNYATNQENALETRNLTVANLVMQQHYGPNISVSADNYLVVDAPPGAQNSQYGKLPLNFDSSFVQSVQSLLNGVQVSVYQCANADETLDFTNGMLACPRVSTTFLARQSNGDLKNLTLQYGSQTLTTNYDVNTSTNPVYLNQTAAAGMSLANAPKQFVGQETIGGVQYEASYLPLSDEAGHLVGVLAVEEPLTAVTNLIDTTTLELIISGLIIMVAGIILAVLVASTIAGTLRRASTQLGAAATQLTTISEQQAGGSRQQVWAINAINQALHNLQETSADVSRRTDQLAQIGTQVAMRRAEIAPGQFESVMNYMTRSVRDISMASHQQTTTVERMASAMQAVVEIADQVANSSQQTSESARRLDGVVTELEHLVAGRGRTSRGRPTQMDHMPVTDGARASGQPMRGSPSNTPMTGAAGPRRGWTNPGVTPGNVPMRGDMSGPDSYNKGGARPMLPSGRRAQSRPNNQMGGPTSWDAVPDDRSYSGGNYPGTASGQYPWPQQWDQERNY